MSRGTGPRRGAACGWVTYLRKKVLKVGRNQSLLGAITVNLSEKN